MRVKQIIKDGRNRNKQVSPEFGTSSIKVNLEPKSPAAQKPLTTNLNQATVECNYLSSALKMVLTEADMPEEEKTLKKGSDPAKKRKMIRFMRNADLKIKGCVNKLVHITQTT
jgi:hypothetical protein